MKPVKKYPLTERSWRRKMINMISICRKKSRAVSPVIATVLLIGLVVIAGIVVALVVFGTINTPAPIKVEVLSISEFETTDDNILIDQFSVTLQNEERTNVRIETEGFELEKFNSTLENTTLIPGWSMNLEFNEILLPAKAIVTIPLSCDPIFGQELTPHNDSIYIKVTVFPEGSTSKRDAKTFQSDLLMVGDTNGPIFLDLQVNTTNLGDTGINLTFSVATNGSTDANLFLEFTADSSGSLIFIVNGTKQDRHYFSLPRFSTTNFPNDVFTINATSQTTVDENYLVLVFLWSETDLTILASASIVLTYTG